MEIDWRARASEVWTVPNLVSLSRLPLLAGIVLTLESPVRYVLFALVVLSDGVDGWLARRLDQATELGALLDPALDKLTALVLFVVLFPRTGLPVEYLLFFFARDAFVLALGLASPFLDMSADRIKARTLGKVVTNLQFLAMVAMLVPHVLATEALLWALGVASALAVADYLLFVARETTAWTWPRERWGVLAAYVGVGAVFAVTAYLLLWSELVALLDAAVG